MKVEEAVARVRGVSKVAKHGDLLTADFGGRTASWKVVRSASPTPGQLTNLALGEGVILDADRVSPAMQEDLARAGGSWWDRRGHLRLSASGVLIDIDVPDPHRPTSVALNPGRPSASKVWLEVCTTLLAEPERAWGTRELERELGRAVSAVSKVLNDLKSRALLTRSGLPLLPDLFWEVAGQWQTQLLPVSKKPADGVLTDSQAAMAWGAPLIADRVPSYYVSEGLSTARTLGPTTWDGRAVVVAEAPVPLALVPHGRRRLAHPLVVALDLAQDVGRGREALSLWDPPAPFVRVW